MKIKYNNIEELKEALIKMKGIEGQRCGLSVEVAGTVIHYYQHRSIEILSCMIEEGIPLDMYNEYEKECLRLIEKNKQLISVPYFERAWIEMAIETLPESLWEEWEMYCIEVCYEVYYKVYTIEAIKKYNIKNTLPLINAIKIMIYLSQLNFEICNQDEITKVIREELLPRNASVYESNNEFNLICQTLEKFCPQYWFFKRIINYDKVKQETSLNISDLIPQIKESVLGTRQTR